MTREEAIAYFKRHIDLYCVTGICREAEEMAIQALEQEPCEDAISKQAVLDLLENTNNGWIINEVLQLPPIKPQEPSGETVSLEAFKQVMRERDIAIEQLKELGYGFGQKIEPKTGHWEMPVQDDGMSDPIYYQVRCSKCGFDLDPQTWHMELHQYGADKYCPKCGARMEVEQNG